MSFTSFKNCSFPWLLKCISFFSATLTPLSRIPHKKWKYKNVKVKFQEKAFLSRPKFWEILIVSKPTCIHLHCSNVEVQLLLTSNIIPTKCCRQTISGWILIQFTFDTVKKAEDFKTRIDENQKKTQPVINGQTFSHKQYDQYANNVYKV